MDWLKQTNVQKKGNIKIIFFVIFYVAQRLLYGALCLGKDTISV